LESGGSLQQEDDRARRAPWVLVAAAIIEYHMDEFAGRGLTLDIVKETDELLMRWRGIQHR